MQKEDGSMKSWITAAAFGVGLLMVNPAQAIVLLDDNFDGETATILNYNAFANWDVVNGTVDTIGGSFGGVACAGGVGVCIDMDGSTGDAGDLVSKAMFYLAAGETITLSFDYSGNQRNSIPDTMTVSLGSFFSETFSNVPGFQGFQTVTRSFGSGAGGTANLVFSHEGGDNVGIILDNVKLESNSDAVIPAPAPVVLMASAVGLAIWRARRARK